MIASIVWSPRSQAGACVAPSGGGKAESTGRPRQLELRADFLMAAGSRAPGTHIRCP